MRKLLENFIDPEVVAVTSNISPLNVNPISLLNCWIRNLATPSVTQRACAFLFKRPVENKLFAVNGYVSKIDSEEKIGKHYEKEKKVAVYNGYT